MNVLLSIRKVTFKPCNLHGMFAAGGALVLTQEKKTMQDFCQLCHKVS